MIEIRDETGATVEIRIETEDFIDAGLLSQGGVILPGHPLYDVTLSHNVPPGYHKEAIDSCNGQNFIFKVDSGLMVPASDAQLTEYLNGGEYDERLDAIGESENENQSEFN